MFRQIRHKLQQVIDGNNRNKVGELLRNPDVFIQRHLTLMGAEEHAAHHFHHKKLTDQVGDHAGNNE